MGIDALADFLSLINGSTSLDDLAQAMEVISKRLGVPYFALTHHVDLAGGHGQTIRLHNYPARWADYYVSQGLGICDPVHRASHRTSVGFRWSRLPAMIILTPADRRMLDLGREQGIGDGFTVPANVPGEARGSCSFASGLGERISDEFLPLAQLAGAFAFEGARRLISTRLGVAILPAPVLTDRQRDCVLWTARGKSDWETSRILGVSEETVTCHLKQARERYGVHKRTPLAIRTLVDGTLCFDDVVER